MTYLDEHSLCGKDEMGGTMFVVPAHVGVYRQIGISNISVCMSLHTLQESFDRGCQVMGHVKHGVELCGSDACYGKSLLSKMVCLKMTQQT